MKEHPILFSGEMVRAILEGRKTQTRQVIKPQPIVNFTDKHSVEIEWMNVRTKKSGGRSFSSQELLDTFWDDICNQRLTNEVLCPYGRRGDRLWVRETWAANVPGCESQGGYSYRADHVTGNDGPTQIKWKPSIHMTRKASRITLEITGVRVERLQDISEEDAIAEGVEPSFLWTGTQRYKSYTSKTHDLTPILSFMTLWKSINGNDSWDLNPWVWVIEFKHQETQ